MNCMQCQHEMDTRKEDFEYGDAGLPGITLVDVEVSRCPHCGEYEVAIPNTEELHRVLAFAMASQKARLSGAEVRFLRKYLGYSGRDFAATIGVDPATVSRWEHEKEPIGPTADRLLRLMAMRQNPIAEYPTERLAQVAQTRPRSLVLRVRAVHNTWQPDLR